MVKIIISFTKFVIALVVTVIFASCQFGLNGITGSGNVVTETRDITENFTSVEASGGLEVVIELSDSQSVVVEADDNVQKHISTKVENGVLKISSQNNHFINVKSKKVIVKMPKIARLEASAGTTMTSGNTLVSDGLTVSSSSGSSVELSVEADKLICESSSGSQITVAGKALSFETSSSSGSEIDASKMLANDVVAQSSSGSSVTVHPIVNLDAKASSGSSVNYNSIPKTIKKEENSGGSVSQQ